MSYHHDEPTGIYGLLSDLYCAGAVACFLYAMHRIANGLMLAGEIKALSRFEDAYTPEERETLIHKIKVQSLSL
jgi:hypothetical protein